VGERAGEHWNAVKGTDASPPPGTSLRRTFSEKSCCRTSITMRLSAASVLALLLSILVLASTSVEAFVLRPRQRTSRRAATPAQLSRKVPSFLFQAPQSEANMVTPAVPPQRGGANRSLAIGFFGRFGLVLLSVFLVKLVYAAFFPSETNQTGGMMDRCPWPFIVFHDPKQFFKDSPTWMIVTYVVLLRVAKMVGTKGVAA